MNRSARDEALTAAAEHSDTTMAELTIVQLLASIDEKLEALLKAVDRGACR